MGTRFWGLNIIKDVNAKFESVDGKSYQHWYVVTEIT